MLRLRKSRAAKHAKPEQQLHHASTATTQLDVTVQVQPQDSYPTHQQQQTVHAASLQEHLAQQHQQPLQQKVGSSATASTAGTDADAQSTAGGTEAAAVLAALEAEIWEPVIPNWKELGEFQVKLFACAWPTCLQCAD